MFPSASKLFSGMQSAAGNMTKMNVAKSSTSMTVVHEGEDGELLDVAVGDQLAVGDQQPHIVITEHCWEQIINLQTSSFLQFLWNLVNLSVIRVLSTSKDYFSTQMKKK